jgi:pyruvate/2-oxoglutarate dehydrogenase complex dihydrolipoamide acyltransferase (E2) component
MDREFVMPSLGVDIEEGMIQQWLKRVGDPVREGEPIVVIDTPKLNMELEAPATGTLKSILAGEDEIVPVGAPLAVISTASE